MTTVIALLLLVAAQAPQTVLVPRDYRTVATELKANVTRLSAADYADGSLWVAVPGGELWRFDSSGKVQRISLPLPAFVKGLWADGSKVIALTRGELLSVSSSDIVTSLRSIDGRLDKPVPVRDGYVAMDRKKRRLVYVSDDGSERGLERRKGENDEATEELLDSEDADGDVLADDGHLAPMDSHRVAYVAHDPYEVWIAGIDGSWRRIAINDSNVITPEQSAKHIGDSAKGLGIEDLGIKKVEFHNGHLYVQRQYLKSLVIIKDYLGLTKGSEVVSGFAFIDVIDLESGEIIERVDVPRIGDAGKWVGFRGDDLVFLSFGPSPVQSRMVIASPR